LGVRFADYFSLDWYTVVTEGPSDREFIEWSLEQIPSDISPLPRLRSHDCAVVDYGGAKQAEGFLKANYEHLRPEVPLVTVFDGDTAGDNARRSLQNYFGQKHIPFQSQSEFVLTRAGFAIEGLFPDAWIVEAHDEHPNWFVEFATDPMGALMPFRIHDSYKPAVQNHLRRRAEVAQDLGWAERWITFLSAVEKALATREKRLLAADGITLEEVPPAAREILKEVAVDAG